ncbi:MAG: glycosyltransferase family 2 protein [Candidatus Kapabacteria bacterium]|nr:glycosyltransferase family 2 protein [Candidatus Kapabacteria bacterium]
MKITVITPSYNQGHFIEETILSVINQSYKNIEYIVCDGGSTDNTLEILKKYEDKLHWISEKDSGQSDAINKGIRMSTGDIICYINSDDYFLEGAFEAVIEAFNNYRKCNWVTGDCIIVNEKSIIIQQLVSTYKRILRLFPSKRMLSLANFIIQPSTFLKRSVIEEFGLIDQSLHLTMDYDYWMKIIQKYQPCIIKKPLSAFRIHGNSKGGAQYKKQFDEELMVMKRYDKSQVRYFFHYLHNMMIVLIYKIIK